MEAKSHNAEFRALVAKLNKQTGLNHATLAMAAGKSANTIKNMLRGLPTSYVTKVGVLNAFNERLPPGEQLTEEELFECWRPLPAPNARARKPARLFEPEGLPDLLTPGIPQVALAQYFRQKVGTPLANQLVQHSVNAITAVAESNFDAQVRIGNDIAASSEEFPQIFAVGHYFAAEGYRLLGDLAFNPAEQKRQYAAATVSYNLALQANPADPRPLRGLARIEEKNEKFDEAETKFRRADAETYLLLEKAGNSASRFYLRHERLRVLRHRIHCLLDLRSRSPANKWNTEQKTNELWYMVHHAHNQHVELMPAFDSSPRWSQIEWFMGWVFLAKAWGSLRERTQLLLALLTAIAIRRRLFGRDDRLTAVERMNVVWWAGVAKGFRDLLDDKSFLGQVELIAGNISVGRDELVIAAIDNLVRRLAPAFAVGPARIVPKMK